MPTGLGDEQLWISATNDNTGTSTAFDDQSGQGNNGTAIGTLVVADTSEGGSFAFDFDGSNDRIDCPSTVLSGSQVFSMSCWVYVDSHDATYGEGIMGQWEGGASSNQVALVYAGPATSLIGLVVAGGSNYSSAASGSSPPTGAWHHLASVADGSNVTLYVDGVSQGATAYSGSVESSPTNNFEIGRYKGSATASDRHCLDGRMDDIRAYTRALTQAEITHLATSRGIEGPPTFTGLGDEQLWLCPSLDDSANDISGYGNDGTYNGGMGTVADTSNGGSLAYDFDGSNDYIDCPPTLSGPSFSASGWFNTDTLGSWNTLFGNYDTLTADRAWRFAAGRQPARFVTSGLANSSSQNVNLDSSQSISTNVWYHSTVTYDDSTNTMELFLDGVSVGTASQPNGVAPFAAQFTIGSSSGLDHLNGQADDIRAYDRVLTHAEITHLASQRGIEGPPPVGLGDEQLWVCPTLTADDVSDITGNGNTALISGTVPVVEDTTGYESFQTANTTAGTDYVYFDAPSPNVPVATLAFWATSDFNQSYAPIAGFSTSQWNDLRFFITRQATNPIARINRVTTTGSAYDDFTMPNGVSDFVGGAMHHWCLVCDGGKAKLYFDGVFVGESATATSGDLNIAGTNLSLGSQDGRTTAASASKYDDIRFYDSALTQSEITHLATSRGIEGPPPVGLGDEQLWLCPSINDSANDISGNGNDGTYQNGMGTIADTSNGGTRAYDFDGSNDYIDCGSAISNTTFSMSAWFNADTTSGSLAGSYRYQLGQRSFYIRLNSAIPQFLIASTGGSSGGNVQITSSSSVSNGTWYHIAATWDSVTGDMKLFLDGSLVASGTQSGMAAVVEPLCLGSYSTVESFFNGKQDDIRFYQRTLTQAEITHLATSRGIEGPPTFTGLGDEQLWLCPSLDDSASDISGYGNNGTYNGGMGTVADVSNGGSLAYQFDGVNDYIDCGNAIAPTTGYSASAWVSSTTFPTTNVVGTIIEKGYDGTDEPFSFGFKNPTDMRSYTYDGAVRGIGTYTHGMSTGTWYHVATTFDGATWKLFVNGVEVATASDSTALSQNSLNTYIGASWQINTVDRFLNAKLDDVRLFYRALTQAEITHLATSRGIEGSPSGPPSSVFFNPFQSKTFFPNYTRRIR